MLLVGLSLSCADNDPQVLVHDADGLGAFAVSDGNIYIVAGLIHDANPTSVVLRMSTSGDDRTTLAQTPNTGSTRVVVSGATIFWLDAINQRVLSMPTSGGFISDIFETHGKTGTLAVDQSDVFVSSANGTERVPRDGSPPQLVTPDFATSIALNASSVAWIDDYTAVNVAPRTGGTPRILSKLTSAAQIAMDDRFVYWVENSNGAVKKAPISGGAVTMLAQGGRPMSIAIDSDWAYWTDNVPDGGVYKIRLDGTSVDPVRLAPAKTPSEVAIDDTSVYWFDFAEGFSIRRTSK